MKRHFKVLEHRGAGISYEVKSGLTRFQAQWLANSLTKEAEKPENSHLKNGDYVPFWYTVE
jgi:hypothetical protein